MFARITKYRMKKNSINDAKALLEKLKPQIMGMKGMKQFLNVMDDSGNGYVVSVVESEDTSEENQAKVNALWGQFGDMLAEPPTPAGFDVLMNETNR